MAFQKAVRKRAKLRLLLCGPSGSGKTYTALRIAHALARHGKIAVLDTERGSASLYVDQVDPDDEVRFTFDVDEPKDYSPDTFIRAIHDAEKAGYDVLILDSITHAWEGVKDEADKGARKKGGNTWAGWADARPQEKAMLDAMLQFSGHIIATARVKTTWEIVEVKGKKEPRKIGLAPEQKQGIEYEFTLAMDMDVDHVGIVTKSRCSLVADAVVQKPGAPFARQLLAWLETGEGEPAKTQPPAQEKRQEARREPEPQHPAETPTPPQEAPRASVAGGLVESIRSYFHQRLAEVGIPEGQPEECFAAAEAKLFGKALEELPEALLPKLRPRLEKTPNERLLELIEPCFVPF